MVRTSIYDLITSTMCYSKIAEKKVCEKGREPDYFDNRLYLDQSRKHGVHRQGFGRHKCRLSSHRRRAGRSFPCGVHGAKRCGNAVGHIGVATANIKTCVGLEGIVISKDPGTANTPRAHVFNPFALGKLYSTL